MWKKENKTQTKNQTKVWKMNQSPTNNAYRHLLSQARQPVRPSAIHKVAELVSL